MKYLFLGAMGLFALPSTCGSSADPTPPSPSDVPGSVTLTGPPLNSAGPQLVVAQPVSAFSDAGVDPSDKTPFQQAKDYHDLGQNWVARLLIEKHALSDAGTKEEQELLLDICKAQRDGVCVQSCAARLGRKIVFDAGAPPAPGTSSNGPATATEHPSETPFSKARDMHLKKRDKEARAILEPRVIDGNAPAEETKLLLEICTSQKDKMCIALCKKQLGQ